MLSISNANITTAGSKLTGPEQKAATPREIQLTDRVLFTAGAGLILLYFFGLTTPSLRVFFSDDDMMNLYRAWNLPLGTLLKANVLFFWSSPYIRPLAEAWYRIIFHFAGFNPYPFHVAYLAIFPVNLLLTYFLSRRLSGSAEVAAVATLLNSHAYAMNFLYFDTGYIYDTLCYCFYFAAFLLYLRRRESSPRLGTVSLTLLCVLYICALNSKEMAVSLPLFLLVYEVLFQPLPRWNARSIVKWTLGDARGILVTGLVTIIFLIGRTRPTPDSLILNPGYQPLFTWTRFMDTSGHFLGELFSGGRDWRPVEILLFWTVMLGTALIARSRLLLFSWLFLMLSPLPVAFILRRSVPLYYIPWFGWTLYAATAIVRPIQYLTRSLREDAVWLPRIRGATLLLVMTGVLYAHFRREGWSNVTPMLNAALVNRNLSEQLHGLVPQFPHGSRLFFYNDPFPADWYNVLFVVRTSYQDDTLVIDRAKKLGHFLTSEELSTYDYVFDYKDERVIQIRPKPL